MASSTKSTTPRRNHIYACRRCTQHKKRCQPTDGACMNCTRARVECSRLKDGPGCNPNGRPLVGPLQLAIQQVEGEVARLWSPGQASRRGSSADADFPDYYPRRALTAAAGKGHHGHTAGKHKYQFALQTAARIGRSLAPAPGRQSAHSYYLARLYGGAELPFPLSARRTHPPLPAPHEPVIRMSPLLPHHVTERLLQVYIDRILPQCPIFNPSELHAIYSRLRCPSLPVADSTAQGDTFIVLMAMAIATLTSKSDAWRKVAELAEALRVEAWQCATDSQFLATTSIRSLQGLLLLAQYGLMMPRVVDMLHTACEAMRMAVEMGLHRDPPEAMGLSREAIHTRWRLFWATYSVERMVTVTYHQPFAIREDQIRLTVFPDPKMNTAVLACGNLTSTARYLTHLAYCQLQTEISDVNVNNEPIRPPTLGLAEWTAVCERRVEELRGADWREAFLIPDWLDLPALRCLAWLYMPCPRNPRPPDETVCKFVATLLRIVDTYWALSRSRIPHIIWFVVHHAHEVGTQLLYCMQTYPRAVKATTDKADLVNAMGRLSELFSSLEERWPAASQCKMLLERLSPSIIASFMKDAPTNALDDTPSDEQRVVDLILRKNSCFFFAKEEVLDIQSYLAESFTHPRLQLDLDDASSSVNSVLASFDLLSGTFMPPDQTASSLLDWPSLSPNCLSDPAPPKAAGLSSQTVQLVEAAKQTLNILPVCTCCRLKRIRCSRALPACHNCQDYGKDCIYVEASTGHSVSGAYLYGQQQRLGNALRQLDDAQSAATERRLSFGQGMHGEALLHRGSKTLLFEYDTPYGPSACYWGESSVLGKLLSDTLPLPTTAIVDSARSAMSLPCTPHKSMTPLLRPLDELSLGSLHVLVERYLLAVETFLPILGRDQLDSMLDAVRLDDGKDGKTTADSALLHLVVAISLVVPFHARAAALAVADHYFDLGMQLAAATDSFFVASTISSLQVSLLVCIYVRLHPAAGSLPRLVSTACRICLDLLESQDLSVAEMATLHVLFRTAYVIDTEAAVDFGRTNYLPEWKMPDKMADHATASDEKGRIALLAYNSAKLRAAIHTVATANIDNASAADVGSSPGRGRDAELLAGSLTVTLRVQLDDWWDEWTREASAQSAPTVMATIAATKEADTGLLGEGDDCQTCLFLYGSFLYFQTVSLLRLLGEGQDDVNSNAEHSRLSPPSSYAESLITTHAAFHGISSSAGGSLDASAVDYGFPVCWSHYTDIFGAGLELLSADESNKKALDNCYNLLRLFEACIGTRDWVLSERLLILTKP